MKKTKVERPRGVYLETSILRKLPFEINTAEFSRLVELCNLLKIPIAIPEVAFQEWISQIKEDFVKNVENVEKSLETTNKLLKIDTHIKWPKKREVMIKKVEKNFRTQLTDLNIVITKTPRISLKLLLKMAINKTRPFEEKREKGFRDSIILFTVLDDAKKSPGKSNLFLAADKGYDHQDVYDLASSHKVKLIIMGSISDAIDHLEKFINRVLKNYYKKRTEKLETFLRANVDEIMKYIRQKAYFDLGTFSGLSRFPVSFIKRIRAIDFLDIGKTIPGRFPEDIIEEKVKISFSLKLSFSVIVEQSQLSVFPPWLASTQLRLEEETGTWERENESSVVPYPFQHTPSEVEQKIERWVNVQALVAFNKDKDEYSNLQIESISL